MALYVYLQQRKNVYCCDFQIFGNVKKTNMADDNGTFSVKCKIRTESITYAISKQRKTAN